MNSDFKPQTELKKSELIGRPRRVSVDTTEEIQILDLTFVSFESKFNELKEKLLKSNKLEVDTLVKLRFLLKNFDYLINNV